MPSYDSSTKDGKCIFCEIINGHIQTPGVFWEDEKFMAFLSTYPSVKGHTVVVPKKHYASDCLAMPDEVLQDFILAAKKVSNILLNYFDDLGRVGLIMEGTGINHAHIKLIPMHGTAHMKKGIWKQYLNDKEVYFEKYDGYLTTLEGPAAEHEELKDLADKLKKSY